VVTNRLGRLWALFLYIFKNIQLFISHVRNVSSM